MSDLQKIQLRVRSYELDSFGHVNNAVFLQYLEFARGEFLLQRGLSLDDFHRWKKFPYVKDVNIAYKSPVLYNNLLEIRGRISKWTGASFTMEKEIFNLTTNRLAARAEIAFVFVNERGRPTAVPEVFKQRFEASIIKKDE